MKIILLILLIIAHLCALIGFLVLGDVTQWIVQLPRWVTMLVFSYRMELIVTGLASLALAILWNINSRFLSAKRVGLHIIVFLFLFSGFFISPYLLFRTQQHDATFISIEEASKYLNKDDEVIVLEIAGDVRAYPKKWITQPHVAGDIVGGKNVVMTYCGLSNLAIAYSPILENGRKLDLKVMLQLENNLVLFDETSGEPFQQIYGQGDFSKAKMIRFPTQIMSWKSFKKLHDNGKVYFNPADSPLDSVARFVAFSAMDYQESHPDPVFPTIDHIDERLPAKQKVYGIQMNGEAVALTVDYLKQQQIVNLQIGGKPVVIAYYPKYDTVVGFSSNTVSVNQIDIHGNTSRGKLDKIPIASKIYWMIWSNFYPGTLLRVHES